MYALTSGKVKDNAADDVADDFYHRLLIPTVALSLKKSNYRMRNAHGAHQPQFKALAAARAGFGPAPSRLDALMAETSRREARVVVHQAKMLHYAYMAHASVLAWRQRVRFEEVPSVEDLHARIRVPDIWTRADWDGFLLWLGGEQGPGYVYPTIASIDYYMRTRAKESLPQVLEGGPDLFDANARETRKELLRRFGNMQPM